MTTKLSKSDPISGALAVNAPETGELCSDGLTTVKEAARFLSLGKSTLYEIMDRGELRYCKFGKSRRIPWRAIHALAEDSLTLAT